ncbi:MAG: tryptophan 7-halogenase [Rhodobacteraceae bacterium]|nr:tryptophan 7-halogenase [Paracoccaceae bacterium]
MSNGRIRKIVIAGGGTAGWMTASTLAKLFGKTFDITLIESEEIGTVGVGEATIPPLKWQHRVLSVREPEFMRAVQGTFKLGICFENWRKLGGNYFHVFGHSGRSRGLAEFHHFWLKGRKLGIAYEFGEYCNEWAAAQSGRFGLMLNCLLDYAFHIDASLYARFLRELAERHDVVRREGRIEQVMQNPGNGFISGLRLHSGQLIEGDLFIDCTGFRGLLIERTLHAGYDDWSHWLPCDSAIAVQTEPTEPPRPYTRAIACEAGWQWRIPLQHRVGNGIVFSTRHWSDEEAKVRLLDSVRGRLLTEPRVIRFRAGQRRRHWYKNCVAVGLASGFIEPLESTSIHLIQRSITRLAQMFPNNGIRDPDIVEFNKQMQIETENIRDFIILHYHVTERTDSAFWRQCRMMEIPDSLRHRIELFRQGGRVFKTSEELFGETSWLQVMLGQGLVPEQYHPGVNSMSDQNLGDFLGGIRDRVGSLVEGLPSHQRFIDEYCKAPAD